MPPNLQPTRQVAGASTASEARRALRAELGALRRRDLKQRARDAGVTQDEVDDAEDEDDTKECLIRLVLQRQASAADAEAAAAARVAALRAELGALRFKDLKKRARDAGITQDEIDDAEDDEDDTKQIVIQLILQRGADDNANSPSALSTLSAQEPNSKPSTSKSVGGSLAPGTLASSHFMPYYDEGIPPKYAITTQPRLEIAVH